jgi:hypothetical protein
MPFSNKSIIYFGVTVQKGCTNSRHQVAVTTMFCKVTPRNCGASI